MSSQIPPIDKLKGRENYDSWRFAVEAYLTDQDLWDCVSGVCKTNPCKKDVKARSKIILLVDQVNYVHLQSTKTAKDAWDRLQAAFLDSGLTRKVGLLRILITTRLENCDSVEDFVNKIITTAHKLTNLGLEVKDEWVGTILLAGLPDHFQPMIMGIESSGIPITADSIKTKLLQDVSTVKNEDGKQVSAMYGFQNQGNSIKSGHNSSFKQFQKSHSNNDNFRSDRDKDRTESEKSSTHSTSRGPRCYECNGYGHIANRCANRDQKQLSRNSSSANKERHGFFSALSAQVSESKSEWYFDSGCSAHLTKEKNAFVNDPTPAIMDISTANNEDYMKTFSVGNIKLPIYVDGNAYDISVKNVYYVPDLRINLLSVSQIVKKGNTVVFDSKGARVFDADNNILASATLENDLFKLDLCSQSAILAKSDDPTQEILWHRRMAHVNLPHLTKLKNGLVHGINFSNKIPKDFVCETCVVSKSHRAPFPPSESKSTRILELIHSDLLGPLDKSLAGSQYMLTFLDDYSHMTFCYFLKKKSQVYETFVNFKTIVENQTEMRIKILRTDNGGEFCSKDMTKFLSDSGIHHQLSVPYSPEQNGKAERLNRTIIEKVRCLLKDSQLPNKFWAEAANTVSYLLNRSPTKCSEVTPLQTWTGRKPTVKHVRIFGCKAYAHIPAANRKKLDPKSRACIFIGYSTDCKAYRLYDPTKEEFFVSRDVIFSEHERGSNLLSNAERQTQGILISDDQFMEAKDSPQHITQTNATGEEADSSSSSLLENETVNSDDYLSDQTDDEFNDPTYLVNPELRRIDPVAEPRIGQRMKRQPDKFNDYVTYAMSLSEPDDPTTLEDIETRTDQHLWKQAMDMEYKSQMENGTWELVDLPPGKVPLNCKWVFRTKRDATGKVVKHKARLVVKGCAQRKGLDFDETFSPVVRYSSIRYLLALAAKRDMDIDQMDAVSAFLQGDLTEEIYMRQPQGYQDSNKVCRLRKSLYGLKQASRIWNIELDKTLRIIGLQQSKFDPCIYFKSSQEKMIFVAVWVDDLLIFSDDMKLKQEVKSQLMKSFKMTDIGEAKFILGFQITRNRKQKKLWMDQRAYIENILKRFGMENCNPAATPLETNIKLSKDQQPSSVDEKKIMENVPYQEAVGSLLFASQVCRPDIAFPVSLVSRFNSNPGPAHWAAVKRILRYMKKTADWRMEYDGSKSQEIMGYCDSDFASDADDRRSVTGYVFLMCCGAISWGTKKQPTTALSTTEAEYMSLSAAVQEALWLRGLSEELVPCSNETPLKIFVDNQGAINLALNGAYQPRTKHIDVRHHFLREKISVDQLIKPIYVPTTDMIADSLTKSLCPMKFNKCIQLQGITK